MDTRTRSFLACAAVALAGLSAMAVTMDGAPPTAVDRRVRRRMRRGPRIARRRVAVVVGSPGYPAGYFPITALLMLTLRRSRARGGAALAASALGGWATHRAVKLFVQRRRPATMRGHRNELEAFPSGHTTASTAIALTTAYVMRREGLVGPPAAIAIGTLVPVVIGVARVAADEHWTTDVIGGWIGGVGVATLAAALYEAGLPYLSGNKTNFA